MDINIALKQLNKEDNNYRLSSNAPDSNATIVFWDSNNSDTQPTTSELTTAWTSYLNANPSYSATDPSISSSTGIASLVADTTPQLGGNLDVNGQDIVSTSNGAIELDPNGSGVVIFKGNSTKGAGQFKLNCEQNSHGITIKGPPHSAAASYTLTLPNDDGTSGQYLQTDGNGVTSWSTASSTDSTKMPLAGGTFTGSVTFEDAINENVYAITDGNAALDPDNGMIQTWTLGANRTATDSLTAGQSMLLVITAGSYTLTFPTITWAGGSAPTLSTSKPTAIELWKIGSTLYGANVGDLG